MLSAFGYSSLTTLCRPECWKMGQCASNYLAEGQITVANGSEHEIWITTDHQTSKFSSFRDKIVPASMEAQKCELKTTASVAPGDSVQFKTKPGVFGRKVYATVRSDPFSNRHVPGMQKVLIENHCMKKGDGVIISNKNEIQRTKCKEIWIDANGAYHKPLERETLTFKTIFSNASQDDVFVMVESNRNYLKHVSGKFKEILYDEKNKEKKLEDWKDFVKVASNSSHEFSYKSAENARVYLTAYRQKERDHDHPMHFNTVRPAEFSLPAGRNVVLGFEGKFHLAKTGEACKDDQGEDWTKVPDAGSYHPSALTTISNGSKYLIYANVTSDDKKLNASTQELLKAVNEDGKVNLDATSFKEIAPGKCEKFDRNKTGQGHSMYITVFYRNPKSKGDRLMEICQRFRVNGQKSIIVGAHNQVLESRRGRLWEDTDGINHFPIAGITQFKRFSH
ncbi:hypothetical protein L596_022021 [Steinernema carpocapsae]|uniref:Uncharacterized protein n=2 Tax=Steinernema carpocapsae TaxID=34508 RepID=A0A4U5MKH4_STECR|nr:hypothetical protein L596_022021 [Steinernema carpocapsae]